MGAANAAASTASALKGTPVRILAVDDDPTSRMLTRATLEEHLGNVVEAENGLIAVQTLEREDFDLAIVDLDMPVMDGFGVIERARARPETRHLPIIVVTGRDDVVAIERAFALGATSFLCKPINWNVFRHQVRYVLQVARREREARAARQEAEKVASFQERAVRALTGQVKDAVTKIVLLSGLGTKAALNDIAATGDNVQSMLARLTRASDVVTGLMTIRLEVTPAAELVRLAVRNLRDRLGSLAADRIEATATATEIFCDRALAVEALEEILTNALSFSPSGSKIRLKAVDAPPNRVRFEIVDDGPGIPEHMLELGFAPFIAMADEKRPAALGVGLAMVKAIMDRHGGHFGIMAEPGRGTEVFMSFPIAAAGQDSEGALNEKLQMSRGKLSKPASIVAS